MREQQGSVIKPLMGWNGIHRSGSGRPESMGDRAFGGVGAAEAEAGLRSAVRPLLWRALPPRHQVPALASRQRPEAVYIRPGRAPRRGAGHVWLGGVGLARFAYTDTKARARRPGPEISGCVGLCQHSEMTKRRSHNAVGVGVGAQVGSASGDHGCPHVLIGDTMGADKCRYRQSRDAALECLSGRPLPDQQ